MAERKALVYERAQGSMDIERFCAALEPPGLSLLHPTSGAAFMLSAAGDQLPTRPNELQARIRSGADTSFQLWYAANHDLYVRVRENDGVRVIELGMEGTNEAERSRLRSALTEYFHDGARLGVGLGLMFDPDGVTQGYDWDDLFVRRNALSGEVLDRGLPALLLITYSLIEKITGLGSIGEDAVVSVVKA